MTIQRAFQSSRGSRAIAATAVAVVMAAASVPAFAAIQQAPSPSIAVPGGDTSRELVQLEKNADRLLLDRIKAVSHMMDKGRYVAAREKLAAAEDTAGAIVAIDPAIVVVGQIEDAKHDLPLEDVNHFRQQLRPVFTRLGEMSMVEPMVAMDARAKLKQAEAKAGNGEVMTAQQELQSAGEIVKDSDAYFPLNYVYAQMDDARSALSPTDIDTVRARFDIVTAEDRLMSFLTKGKGELEFPTL